MEHDPILALYQKHAALDTMFKVIREDECGRRVVLVRSNDLTREDLAAMTPELRAKAAADEARWAEVFDEIDRIAAEEEAHKRDGETCVHNAVPDERTVVECEAE